MTFFPADSRLYSVLFGDPEIAAHFTDDAFVRRLLAVEAALAAAEADVGIISRADAAQIAAATETMVVDETGLRRGLEQDGVPVSELVRQLRGAAGSAADYVHWGATTQDIVDTAFVLQARDALEIMRRRLDTLIAGLADLSDRHRHTLMAGRTHSQQALPILFGLKVAGWLAPLLRHRRRLAELGPRLLVVQFGGAAGTLAALGDRGPAVETALAARLGLGRPLMPWHTQRDNMVELAGWLSLVSGTTAKMAQDVILMAQSEVGEVRETDDPVRGGSSAMPQKTNPVISEAILAAARVNASLLASVHQAQIQEHERGTHGWQMEWLTLPPMLALTGAALHKAVYLSQNLVVDAERMRANITESRGLMLAEALSYALTATVGRQEAARLVGEACRMAEAEGRHLIDIAREMITAAVDWEVLRGESAYLGMAEALIERVIREWEIERARD